MAYQVVKTIKGKQYLYSQSTYREGGKVKTISHYIGAVDSQTGVLTEPKDDPDHPRPYNTADQIAPIINHPKATQPDSEPVNETPLRPAPLPTPKFKLKPYCNISFTSLQNDHRQKLNTLKTYGVDPATFPPVTVKHGPEYRHYKPAFSTGLVITAPKKGFNRETLRTEYRRALHRAFIDTLEKEAPEKLYPFKYAFDKSYRQTQDALTRYLMNTNSKNKFYKVLALKFFNVMNPVPAPNRKTLAPETIGLVEYGKRKNWKDDYASLMTAIDKQGIKHLNDQAQAEIAKANATQRKTLKTPTIFFLTRRKTVKRAQARIDANRELVQKLNLIYQYGLSTKIR